MDERIFRLDDRPAIVVGGESGIGRAIAVAFGAVGAIVGCVDITEESARETADTIKSCGGQAVAFSCDVTKEADVNDVVERFTESSGKYFATF